MIKRVSVGVVLAIGAVWVLATFSLGLWGKTAAADRLTKDLKPAFSSAGLRQESADAAAVNAVVSELSTTTIPFLAAQLHTTPQAVVKLLAGNPAIAKALGTTDNAGKPFADEKSYLVHASGYLTTVVSALQAEQHDFTKASDIPTSALATTTLAWLFLVLGVVALALGVLVLTKPALIKPLVAGIAALGVVVVAVTYLLDVPGKTQALDNVTNEFRPVFTSSGPLSIAEGGQYLAAVRAADVELETKVIPALPNLLKLSPAAVADALRSNSPAVAGALLDKDKADPKVSVLAGIVGRFDALAATVQHDIGDFRSTDRIPGLGWPATSVQVLLVVPALVLMLGAAGLAVSGRTRRQQPSTTRRALAGVGR